jgi:hypothetical protein
VDHVGLGARGVGLRGFRLRGLLPGLGPGPVVVLRHLERAGELVRREFRGGRLTGARLDTGGRHRLPTLLDAQHLRQFVGLHAERAFAQVGAGLARAEAFRLVLRELRDPGLHAARVHPDVVADLQRRSAAHRVDFGRRVIQLPDQEIADVVGDRLRGRRGFEGFEQRVFAATGRRDRQIVQLVYG